jgi:hypothetical protein
MGDPFNPTCLSDRDAGSTKDDTSTGADCSTDFAKQVVRVAEPYWISLRVAHA